MIISRLSGLFNRASKHQISHFNGFGVLKDGLYLSGTDGCNTPSLGLKLGLKRFIHSSSQKEFEAGGNNFFERENGRNNLPEGDNGRNNFFERGNERNNFFERGNERNNFPGRDTGRNNFFEADNRPNNFSDRDNGRNNFFERGRGRNSFFERDNGRNDRSMNFVWNIMQGDERKDRMGFSHGHYNVENNADIVHVKLMKNNTFVTVTDSKGNKKIGASSGVLSEMKGGPKLSRYAAEATAEHIGRVAKSMGVKSVVMKVNGFTYFKKKKQAILSFRDGYTNSRSDQNPIVYIEDTTRKPHNGCRLRKKRRV